MKGWITNRQKRIDNEETDRWTDESDFDLSSPNFLSMMSQVSLFLLNNDV